MESTVSPRGSLPSIASTVDGTHPGALEGAADADADADGLVQFLNENRITTLALKHVCSQQEGQETQWVEREI